jgi:hypothetical protein
MGAQPEELERDIQKTRAELGRTLDELEYRLSPKRIVSDNKQKIGIALGAMAALTAILVGRKVVRSRRDRD